MPPPVSSAVILTKSVGGNEVNDQFLHFFVKYYAYGPLNLIMTYSK